jgi:hypothetical protein
VVLDGADEGVAVAHGRDDLAARVGEEPRDAFSKEDGVLRDHDPHGMSALTMVPPV